MKNILWVLGVIGFIGVSQTLYAGDTAYQRGLALEKAKNYQAALTEFLSVPREDPAYVKSCKEIGTCYYYLGQKQQAVEAYDFYLYLNPADSSMKAFVDGLRQSAPVPTPVTTFEAAAAAPEETVVPFERRLGFRGSVGYGFALTEGGFGYGGMHDYVSTLCTGCFYLKRGVGEDVQDDKPYRASPGAGLALGAEILMAVHPQLELGLGAFPLGVEGRGSSDVTHYGNIRQTDTSSTQFQALPIIVSVYGKIPVGPKALSLLLGFGLGYAAGGTLKAHSDYVYDVGAGNPVTSRDLSKSLAGAVAYRTMAGADYAFNQHFSLLFGVALMLVNFSATQDSITESSSQGSSSYNGNITIQYVDSPPESGTLVHSGPSAIPNGVTESWDDGRTKKTETFTVDPMTGKTHFQRDINTREKKGLASNDLAFAQCSPFLALTWRY